MFPWIWYWSPQFDFPLSGNVKQDFSPDWFFSAIKPTAGNGQLEGEIFNNASYGKQHGLMMKVLLSLANNDLVNNDKANESLGRLKTIYGEIGTIKTKHSSKIADEAIKLLNEIKASDPNQFVKVLEHFRINDIETT